MDRKQESAFTGSPCFASGTLSFLNPRLICNFVQGTRKTSKTTLLSRSSSAQNQVQLSTQRGQVKSRLLPGGPCSSECYSARTLHTLSSNFQVLQVSSYQVYFQDNKTQEQRVHTPYF